MTYKESLEHSAYAIGYIKCTFAELFAFGYAKEGKKKQVIYSVQSKFEKKVSGIAGEKIPLFLSTGAQFTPKDNSFVQVSFCQPATDIIKAIAENKESKYSYHLQKQASILYKYILDPGVYYVKACALDWEPVEVKINNNKKKTALLIAAASLML